LHPKWAIAGRNRGVMRSEARLTGRLRGVLDVAVYRIERAHDNAVALDRRQVEADIAAHRPSSRRMTARSWRGLPASSEEA
jgi:hypothetical protein